ncbi:Sulfite reductase [ferredoxin] [Planctomycetes bacterium Pan216]|uniref:Sulfite reductase [ferredoxin] n=1 Tax=Kolteria novifilia TaxID=2527975 RepID=A0A518B0J1_9BACT|nr:Sulfite reductase [ferredoxin] [Planctomycetes bacterium Pan216]
MTDPYADNQSAPASVPQPGPLHVLGSPDSKLSFSQINELKTEGVFLRKSDSPGKFMIRIRIPGCELTADQAREVAFVAYEYGHGIVDVTRRAGLQVQGLDTQRVAKAVERLEAVGLSTKRTGWHSVRNIYCHPLSGIDPDEVFDTRELCVTLSERFVANESFRNLTHKFNVALNGSSRLAISYWLQDLCFLAVRGDDGDVGFRVLIGGRQGESPSLARHLPVLIEPEHVPEVAERLVEIYREHAPKYAEAGRRFDTVVDALGLNELQRLLEEGLDHPLIPCVAEPPTPVAYDDLVGWFSERKQGFWAMGLAVPVGRMSWEQLEAISVAAKRWGNGTLRTTQEMGIVVPGIKEAFRDSAATEVGRVGLSPFADTQTRNIYACTGRQFCSLAITETKRHALRLIDELRRKMLTLHGIRIHMSGCNSGCMQHMSADIGLKGVRVRRMLGTREGFDVYLGGGIAGRVHLARPYRMGVDVEQLPQVIEEIVREYYVKHRPGYTFTAYWREVLRHHEAKQVQEGEYVPPTWVCEACNYRHRGEDPPVFCPECAALRRHFARDEREQSEETTLPAPTNPIESDADSFDDEVPMDEIVQVVQQPQLVGIDRVKKAAETLVDWLRQAENTSSQQQRKSRGRPRDPEIARRDRLIRRLVREQPHLGHTDVAKIVSERLERDITTHMVRNALKRGGQTRGSKETLSSDPF